MDDFYVHLTSGDDKRDKTDKRANFVTELASPIPLPYNSTLQVALCEISFPTKLETINVKNAVGGIIIPKFCSNNAPKQVAIQDGSYTASTLVTYINEKIKTVLPESYDSDSCQFIFNSQTNLVEVLIAGTDDTPENLRVTFLILWPLSYFLGFATEAQKGEPLFVGASTKEFPTQSHHKRHAIAQVPSPLKKSHTMLCYLDILKEQVLSKLN